MNGMGNVENIYYFRVFLLSFIISAERDTSSVVIQDVHHLPNNEPVFAVLYVPSVFPELL